MIIERTKVQAAYTRARELGADHESACLTVAQELGVAIESVREVVARHTVSGERGNVQWEFAPPEEVVASVHEGAPA